MPATTLTPASFQKFSNVKLNNQQLLRIKGGEGNPPNPNGDGPVVSVPTPGVPTPK